LTTDQYGILNALFAFLALLMVTGITIQIYTAKQVADSKWEDRSYEELKHFGLRFIVFLGIVILLMIPLLIKGLRTDIGAVLIVSFIFGTNFMVSLNRGIMQGKKAFIQLNLSFYIEVLTKILWLVIFLPIFKNIYVALFGLFVGMLLALWHSDYVLRHICEETVKAKKGGRESGMKILRALMAIFMANFFLYYFTSINMMMVNYYLPDESGIYAVAAKYSQVFVHVGFSVITVLIPLVSAYKSNLKRYKKEVIKYLLLFFGGGVIGLILYRTFIPQTIYYFFDKRYHDASAYVFIEGIAFYFLILSYLLISMDIVQDRNGYVPILGMAAVAITLGIYLNHNHLIQMIWVEIWVYMGLFSILMVRFLKRSEIK